MKLALKIDVDTYRGTREGVLTLVEILRKHNANATFLWSLGPDHTGRAIKRVFRPGFLKKVSRTSVVEHYGIRTLLYGTVLPGPDIGRRCAPLLRAVRDHGFEVGIHCWDHIKWQDGVGCGSDGAPPSWTEHQMQLAVDRFAEIFGEAPRTHGAAGWQMNAQALRLTQQLGFDYASDGRGTHPFLPVYRAEVIHCPQLPTTLPTLDELIGLNGVTADNVAEHLLSLTATPPDDPYFAGHVYTLHAELEGMRLAHVFDQLLAGWKAQGYALVSTRQIFDDMNLARLPRCMVEWGEVPGRSGLLLKQGPEFLVDALAA